MGTAAIKSVRLFAHTRVFVPFRRSNNSRARDRLEKVIKTRLRGFVCHQATAVHLSPARGEHIPARAHHLNMQSLMASNALAGARASYAPSNSRAALNRRVGMATRRPVSMTVRAGKTPDGPKVAIAGISGAVGTEFMRVSIVTIQSITRTVLFRHDRDIDLSAIGKCCDRRFFAKSLFFPRRADDCSD